MHTDGPIKHSARVPLNTPPRLQTLLTSESTTIGDALTLIRTWAKSNELNLPTSQSPHSNTTKGIIDLLERVTAKAYLPQKEAQELAKEAAEEFRRQITRPEMIHNFPGVLAPTGWAEIAVKLISLIDPIQVDSPNKKQIQAMRARGEDMRRELLRKDLTANRAREIQGEAINTFQNMIESGLHWESIRGVTPPAGWVDIAVEAACRAENLQHQAS